MRTTSASGGLDTIFEMGSLACTTVQGEMKFNEIKLHSRL